MQNSPEPNRYFTTFDYSELRTRRTKLQKSMASDGLSCLIIWGATTHGNSTGNISTAYLTNYAGIIQDYLILPAHGEPILLITRDNHIPNARQYTDIADIRGANAYGDLSTELSKALEDVDAKGKVGIVGAYRPFLESIPHAVYQYIESQHPGLLLENRTEWYERQRRFKSEAETDLLDSVGTRSDRIFSKVLAYTKPGATTGGIRKFAEHQSIDEDLNLCFSHIGASSMNDQRNWYPDFFPAEQRIERGDILTSEFAFGVGTYWNKIFGSWVVGEPSPLYEEMAGVAERLYSETVSTLRPGCTALELDDLASRILHGTGFELTTCLINGWANANHDPYVGTISGTKMAEKYARYRDWVFETGETLSVRAGIRLADKNSGLWIGTSGFVSDTGYQSFNADWVPRLQRTSTT